MNSEVEDLFEAARRLKEQTQRRAFLDAACGQDPGLRRELEELLALESDAKALLDGGAAGLDPKASELRQFPAALLASAPVKEQPGEWVGRYRLLQKLGEGGCGVVYMAEQEEPVRRRVALKIIKLGMDTRNVVARFEAERQALALMDHPNIAKVLDAGATETGRPFFVMELVRGVKITEYCDQHSLAVPERLDLFVRVCQAVQHAHQKGVIHRDLKPSNILVTVNDGVAVPKVIDFGIAKATGGLLTDRTLFTPFEQFVGTPAYMSPEQAAMTSVDIDTRSDIYSLGVLLYELLTGNTPFETKDLLKAGLEEMRRLLRDREPARPSTRLTVLPATDLATVSRQRQTEAPRLVTLLRGDLDWIVMKALEKDRARRYETANGLVLDIQRYLHSEPVVARPPSTVYRFQKLVKRNRLQFAAVSAMAASLIIGFGVSVWQFIEKSRAYDRAVAAESNERKARQEAQTAHANEAEKRKAIQAVERRLAETLERFELQNADELFRSDNAASAVARLVRLLRQNPTNEVAAQRLFSALMYRNFGLCLNEALKEESGIRSIEFSSDGQRVVTAAGKVARIWDLNTGRPLTEPLHHEAEVSTASFSLDGRQVVTACGRDNKNNYAQVWDAFTGQPLTEPLRHTNSVWSAQLSPDGQRVVTTSIDTFRIWDAKSGQLLQTVTCKARLIRFSPDSRRVATADSTQTLEGTVQVWDTQTGQPVGQAIHLNSVPMSMEFSPDGQRVLTGCSPVGVYTFGKRPPVPPPIGARIWDSNTGLPLTPVLEHAGGVYSARFSPDGLRVVTASPDKTARVWDAQTGQPLTPALRHGARVFSAEFSPDGLRIVTASEDKTARVWDAKSGDPLSEPLKHKTAVSAHFTADGQRVVTASGQRLTASADPHTARIWDTRPRPVLTKTFTQSQITSAQFSPDGKRVLTWSYREGKAVIWDERSGRALTELPHAALPLSYASFTPDGARVVTVALTGSAESPRVWDAETGQLLRAPLKDVAGVTFARFSRDGLRIVTWSRGRTARVWDAQTGLPLTSLQHTQMVTTAQFSPDGLKVLTTSQEQKVWQWDAQTGRLLIRPIEQQATVFWAQLSPDGLRIVTGSADNTAQIWDVKTGRKVGEPLKHEDEIRCIEFSPDSQRLVTGSVDKTARVWDAVTGRPLTGPLSHEEVVTSVRFSPDGSRVVTSSRDKTARVWDSRSGQPISEPLLHDEAVNSVDFSPDGQRLLTTSGNTARVWELPTVSLPVPDWAIDMAEAVANSHLDEQGVLQLVPLAELQAMKKRITESPDSDAWTHLAKGLLENTSEQLNSSFSAGGPR